MTMRTLPQIVLVKWYCTEYGTCWHAEAPYYTGHYRTKASAEVAATKTKREMAANGELEDRK